MSQQAGNLADCLEEGRDVRESGRVVRKRADGRDLAIEKVEG